METEASNDTTTHLLVDASKSCKVPSLTGEVTPVLVGDKLLHLHTAVLVSSSNFFRNAMKPEWRLDSSKPIDLSDEDPAVFESYCQWLYTQKVVFKETAGDYNSLYLAHLYVLGEKLMDVSFQNIIIDMFINRGKTMRKYPSNRAIKIIYEGTTANSHARRLLVDSWAFAALPKWRKNYDLAGVTCTEFMNDVVWALVQHRETPTKDTRPWIVNAESYKTAVTEEEMDISGA